MKMMTTNVYLSPNSVYGGVFNGDSYTFFLTGGGLCVLPKYLVEKYGKGEIPEEKIEHVVHNGLNSGITLPSIWDAIKKKDNNESFLNLRNHE